MLNTARKCRAILPHVLSNTSVPPFNVLESVWMEFCSQWILFKYLILWNVNAEMGYTLKYMPEPPPHYQHHKRKFVPKVLGHEKEMHVPLV